MAHLNPASAPRPTGAWLLWVARASRGPVRALNALRPAAALAARLAMAQVFWWAGLTKLRDWGTTLDLFAYEYQVPLLPPPVAAVLGTGAELLLPVLLVLGLGGRVAALGLSVVNAVAVLSLPDMPQAAFQLHVFWGSLLAGLAIYGPGRWSLDCWLGRRWGLHGMPAASA